MKIAVVLGDLSPAAGGGYTFQEDLLQALLCVANETSHEFLILAERGSGHVQKGGLATNVRFDVVRSIVPSRWRRVASSYLQGLEFVFRLVGALPGIDRYLRDQGIELVWFATPFYEKTDIPFIYTVWDLQHRVQPWFPEVSAGARWEFRERAYRFAMQRAYFTIVANSSAQQEAERFYGVAPERLRVLPHPTPSFAIRASTSKTDFTSRSESELAPYIFYPAQFGPHKNHAVIIRALSQLKSSGEQQLQAVFVGSDRGNLAYVKEYARRHGVAERISFQSFVTREQLIRLYVNAVALVFPSFFGPENLPPLEAFALGCPVIAADVNGAREQLQDAALLFPPTDCDALVRAIQSLVGDSGLRLALVRKGRERAQAWTAQQYVEAVIREMDAFVPIRECWA